jgi:hypothetical protein
MPETRKDIAFLYADKNALAFAIMAQTALLEEQLEKAMGKHAPLNSAHEAYAVILEELDEFKAEVWKRRENRDTTAMQTELLHVAAMAIRTIIDLGL